MQRWNQGRVVQIGLMLHQISQGARSFETNMLYHVLADIVVAVHFSFVLFVLFGGILALKWKRLVWVHVPAFLWGGLIEFLGWLCPLTHLEYWFIEKAGAIPYQSSFVEHYIVPLLYPTGLTREHQIIFGFFVIAVNLAVYGCLIWRSTRRRLLSPGR